MNGYSLSESIKLIKSGEIQSQFVSEGLPQERVFRQGVNFFAHLLLNRTIQ